MVSSDAHGEFYSLPARSWHAHRMPRNRSVQRTLWERLSLTQLQAVA